MRILIVSNLYPPAVLGGYEILCAQVAERLAARGHAVAVLTSDFRPDGPSAAMSDGAKPFGNVWRDLNLIVPFGKPLGRARVQHLNVFRRNRAATARRLAAFKPDVVFFWSQRRLSLGTWRAATERGIPCALTLNDDYLAYYRPAPFEIRPRKLASWALDRSALKGLTWKGLDFSRVTTISRALQTGLIAQGVPVEGARVIYQAIPLERFPAKSDPGALHDPLRLLYAGQVHDYKGVHTVVEALGLLTAEGRRMNLSIVGGGEPDYLARLKTLARDLGVAEKVLFQGRVKSEKLPGLYREADLFVFPSDWEEPFGLTHLEAMASGTPVVSTTRGGTAELIAEGRNALTFNAGDAAGLAARLRWLSDHDSERRELAQSALDDVRRRFNMDRYVDDLEAWLGEAVSAARPGRN